VSITRFGITSIYLLTLGAALASAQSPPTFNVIERIALVESEHASGTTFSIDVDGREYWITAKHILTGAKHPPYGEIKEKSIALRLLDTGVKEGRWLSVVFSVIDPGKDIDIVVLAPPSLLLATRVASVPASFSGTLLGGDCEFLGYPSATRGFWAADYDNGKFRWMPYLKHCFISSLPDRKTTALILDGVNNPGFSGGPVIYRTGSDQKIIAVISGIITEPAEVISSALPEPEKKQPTQHNKNEKIDVNSGFIVAFSIDPAVEAIRKNPIGPLRPVSQ
jgi:hypothetical protein